MSNQNEMKMVIAAFVGLLGLASHADLWGGARRESVEVVGRLDLAGGSVYCLAGDILDKTGNSIREISLVRLQMQGESVSEQYGNYLYVEDRHGRNIGLSVVELPYHPGEVSIEIENRVGDICLHPVHRARIRNLRVSYTIDDPGGRPRPPREDDPRPRPPEGGIFPRGLFVHSGAVYLSDGRGGYCHVQNPDQHRILSGKGEVQLGQRAPGRDMRLLGECALEKVPRGFFMAKLEDRNAVYFSDGQAVCWVQHSGMLAHMSDYYGTRSVSEYDRRPDQSLMPYSGYCKVPGYFSIMGRPREIYESNGRSYCKFQPGQVPDFRKGRVYEYQDRPLGLQDAGVCPYENQL